MLKLPFHLRQTATESPAAALLLPGHDAAFALAVCAQLALDPLPPLYAVADGYLLTLPSPPREAVVGCVRLRALADRLLIPADAELVPALLPDEAAALVSRRGLVFLPGGRVLEWNPQHPVQLSSLLTAGAMRRDPWRPLPVPPLLAERIEQFIVEESPLAPDDLLAAGGPGAAEGVPQSPDKSLPSKALGKTAFGLGKSLAWLGQTLGLKGLQRAGAKLIGAAMGLAPKLVEQIFGKQDASLRELLRRFREGDAEEALRHAIPLGQENDDDRIATGTALPTHDARYSLRDLLAHSGGGGGWMSSDEVYLALQAEYRRLAEDALRRGDYRRAAFIYGKLLRDYHRAASALSQGGLHRDAATIYERKLHDSVAAAREYEAAGDLDRALELYVQCGEHAMAGDLLRRAGEEEEALPHYLTEAFTMTRASRYYEAGELMRTRAQRSEWALHFYDLGWQHRPAGSPVPTALRLAEIHAGAGKVEPLLTLVSQAEEYLRPAGNDGPAAEFFNGVARLAERSKVANVRDELRDRALLGVAAKMRQQARVGSVSSMMPAGSPWPAAVVSDAQFALKRVAVRRPAPAPKGFATTRLEARIAVVTATCWAPESGDVFVGFQSGEVYVYRPRNAEAALMSLEGFRVAGLTASLGGKSLAVLSAGQERSYLITMMNPSRNRMGQKLGMPLDQLLVGGTLGPDGDPITALVDPEFAEFEFLHGSRLVPLVCAPLAGFGETRALLFLGAPDSRASKLLTFGGEVACYGGPWYGRDGNLRTLPFWLPLFDGPLSSNRLSWVWDGPTRLQVAGLVGGGQVGWAELRFEDDNLADVRAAALASAEPFRAVTLVGPGTLAAVTGRTVHRLRVQDRKILSVSVSTAELHEPVACFPWKPSNELIVVCGDGAIARVSPLR